MRFTLLLSLSLVPGILLGQKRTDKKILADLKAENQTLTTPQMANTCIGSPGQQAISEWLAGEFRDAGLEPPENLGGYLQSFPVDKGKAPGTDSRLKLGDTEIPLGSGFFPMPYSAGSYIKGTPLISVQEQSSPWIISVSDLLDKKQTDPRYDLSDTLYDRAKQAAADGATAVIFYSMRADDGGFGFDSQDEHDALGIPVVYVKSQVASSFFKDDSGSVALDMAVSSGRHTVNGYNVAGYINNHAASTVILAAHDDYLDTSLLNNNKAGLPALLELARMLKEGKPARNNYLLVAFSGNGQGLTGAEYFAAHPLVDLHQVNFVIDLDMADLSQTETILKVSGSGSSTAWNELFTGLKDPQLDWHKPMSDTLISPRIVFLRLHIPAITLSEGGGIDSKNPKDMDKYSMKQIQKLYKIVETADSGGKLGFAAPAQ